MKEDDKMKLKEFEKKVLKTIIEEKLIQENDKIVLAVSGGPDSICMLNILNKIKNCKINPSPFATFAICVAHVNHNIRKEATEDELYVKEFCQKNKIDFYSKSIDVKLLANNKKIGLEEAGRIARYDFFDEVLDKTGFDKVAIAHNKNDKVETVIMNLLRGSSISGLKGIGPKRGKYIRPLINCERFEIEQYCDEENLNPRIDVTNFDNSYTRNKIRNIVIPYVKKEFNPNFIETVNRLSSLVTEEEVFIENLVKEKYKNILIEENIKNSQKYILLDLKKFNHEERVIKSRIILYTITKLFGNSKGIEKVHIDDILKLCSNNIGNKYLTPNKNIKILIKNHKIYFLSQV